MSAATWDRLFGWRQVFDDPVTLGIVAAIAAAMLIGGCILSWLVRRGNLASNTRTELLQRFRSRLVLVPVMLVLLLLGAAWTILGISCLSLLCYRDFARATGLFREKIVSLVVVLGMVAVLLAVLDNWYELFEAMLSFTLAALVAAALLPDRPGGYVRRFGLGVLAFVLFGAGLGHLAFFANERDYRPILLMLFFAAEANVVFAYTVGKTLGTHPLAPNTTPRKTWEGFLAALLLTTPLVAGLAHIVFEGRPLDQPVHLIALGLIVSLMAQLGDLMLCAIKRDLGIQDTGTVIPGHGGLLDRFDHLILVGPPVYHYIRYFGGLGLEQPVRIFTSGN
jgi:phosphatidate cytidylyltransferase